MNKTILNHVITDEFLEEDYKSDLDLIHFNKYDFTIENSNPLKSVISQEYLFNITKNEILMFSRGFVSNIFSSPKVLNSFEKMVLRLTSQKKEDILKIIIKEPVDSFMSSIKASEFMKTYELLTEKYSNEIIKVLFVSPNDTVYLDKTLDIDSDNQIVFNYFDEKRPFYFKDLKTFQIVDKAYIRLRKNIFQPHNSEALLNFGRPVSFCESVSEYFYTIASSSKNNEFINLKEIL